MEASYTLKNPFTGAEPTKTGDQSPVTEETIDLSIIGSFESQDQQEIILQKLKLIDTYKELLSKSQKKYEKSQKQMQKILELSEKSSNEMANNLQNISKLYLETQQLCEQNITELQHKNNQSDFIKNTQQLIS